MRSSLNPVPGPAPRLIPHPGLRARLHQRVRNLSAALGACLAAALFMMPLYASAQTTAACCLAQPGAVPLNTQVMARGLEHPWGLAFLPGGGAALVTERPGRMRYISSAGVSAPLTGLPVIEAVGQGGLMDVAVDPLYAQTGLIFFSYTEASAGGRETGTAVARGRLNIAQNRLENVERIFTMSPKGRTGRHFGSRLRFAPDGMLFITIGDRGEQPRAQDPADHAGSVLRITRDGAIPADNPFASGRGPDGRAVKPEIWSLGHRNPQGAAIHPRTGQLWTVEHGPAGGDEINRPLPGRNYGWPLISYGRNYSGRGFQLGNADGRLEQPVYYWDPSIAPSGLAFYDPAASGVRALIPAFQGSLFAGALRGRHLSRLIMSGDRIVGEERYFQDRFGRIRDVRTGPDGALWLLTDDSEGQIIRVTAR